MRAKRLMCLTTTESMVNIIKYILAPLVTDAISSKVVDLLLFCYCSHYVEGVYLVLTEYLFPCIVSKCAIISLGKRELFALLNTCTVFSLFVLLRACILDPLPHGGIGRSAICECSLSWGVLLMRGSRKFCPALTTYFS